MNTALPSTVPQAVARRPVDGAPTAPTAPTASTSTIATAAAAAPTTQPLARHLRLSDIPSLMALEQQKWTAEQAASAEVMAARIAAYPGLCFGAFCPHTGKALSSLFLKPTSRALLEAARSWDDCANLETRPSEQDLRRERLLFGISMSSTSPRAVDVMLDFYLVQLIRHGWRGVVLGSPIPGLRNWKLDHPHGRVEDYVYSTVRGRPRDPQLRYYDHKGFHQILKVLPNYFPHEASLDHGVLIATRIPLAWAAPLWRQLPPAWTAKLIARLGAKME